MKLIWQIVKKDIVRDRWLLALWSLLIVGRVGVGFAALNTGGYWPLWEPIHDGLQVVQVLLGYWLVLRMVQADGLIGAQIAWATRPISGGRLLLAKAVGALLIFGLLPVLMQLPWWLACHFEPSVLARTAVEVFGWQLVLIAAGFLVGSLTEEAGQVLLGTLLLVLGLFVWFATVVSSASAILQGVVGQIELAQVVWTPLWPCLVGFLVSVSGVVAFLYLTRHRLRSLVLVACAYVGLILLGVFWPVIYSALVKDAGSFARLSPEEEAKLSAVTFQVTEPAKVNSRDRASEDKSQRSFYFGLRVGGLPSDLSIANGTLSHQWTWADGVSFRGHGSVSATGYRPGFVAEVNVLRRELSLPILEEDPETARWNEERQHKEVVRREKENAERIARGLKPMAYSKFLSVRFDDSIPATGYAAMPLSLIEKAQEMPPTYQAKVTCELVRPEMVIALPLDFMTKGAARSHTAVAQLAGDPSTASRDVLVIVVKTTRPHVDERRWYPNSLVRLLTATRPVYSREIDYYFVNRVTGFLGQRSSRSAAVSSQMQVCGVLLCKGFLGHYPSKVVRNGQWVVQDPQWREHTSLVLMRDREVARIERTVTADRFEIEPTDRK